MGFWDDVVDTLSSTANAVADTFETVADVVETIFNVVGDTISDVIETIGNGIQDGLIAFGGLLNKIPFIGSFLSGFLVWIGGIVAGIYNFAGAVVKAWFGMNGGLLGGLIKIIGGILTLHGSLILDGLIDIVASYVGAFISVLGTLASLFQRLIPFINTDRVLTPAEKKTLKLVFRDSLALYNIRIKSNNGVGGTFTLNNTIYTDIPNLMIPLHTLVHECTHVWQYQNLGSRYLAESLGAQAIYGRRACASGIAYDWLGEINRGKTMWKDFNREAQAELIEEIWIDGTVTINIIGTTQTTVEVSNGAFYKKPLEPEDLRLELIEKFIASNDPIIEPNPRNPSTNVFSHCKRDGNDHTLLAINSVITLRGKWNFRLSKFI